MICKGLSGNHLMIQPALPLSGRPGREIFSEMRNFLAGRLIGATRDEALLTEVAKSLFCKMAMVRSGIRSTSSDPLDLARTYRQTFAQLDSSIRELFGGDAELLLDPAAISFVDSQLDSLDLLERYTDPLADMYEAFVGSAVRGQEGQFFTPRNAVNLLVDMIDPAPGERLMDPACGSGAFLSAAARHLLIKEATFDQIAENLYGIDKDAFLADLARVHLALEGGRATNIVCADSIAWDANGTFAFKEMLGTFDVVLTNPPFGKRIVAASPEVLRKFQLGRKWKHSGDAEFYEATEAVQSAVPPQVLFVERCVSLLKPGGRCGIVVPESLVSSKSYRHVVQFLRSSASVTAVVGMPEALFKTSGKGGTHTKTCLLVFQRCHDERRRRPHSVFLAEARWCGHDSRGKSIPLNDLPEIAEAFSEFKDRGVVSRGPLGYGVSESQIADGVLAPRYYDPEVQDELSRLSESHDLRPVSDLVEQGLLRVSSGDEVGKLSYGMGDVPFVRTSDLSNWEIKINPKHLVPREVYESLRVKQDVRENDILMVRDGTYLIGTCALVTKYDVKMVYQSHIYKLRVLKGAPFDAFLLLAILSSSIVQKQIKAKSFTQDIIDSLGDRIMELLLPFPKSSTHCRQVSELVREVIQQRIQARESARRAAVEVLQSPSRS